MKRKQAETQRQTKRIKQLEKCKENTQGNRKTGFTQGFNGKRRTDEEKEEPKLCDKQPAKENKTTLSDKL